MKTHGSTDRQLVRGNSDMGFPVATAITAGASIASTVLPAVFGGDSGPSRREQMLRQQEAKRRFQNAQREIEQLRDRLNREMTVERAQRILDNNAENRRLEWKSEWKTRMLDLPNGDALASSIAEQAQQVYLDAANWAVVKAGAPQIAGIGAAVVGAGAIGYSLYKRQTS